MGFDWAIESPLINDRPPPSEGARAIMILCRIQLEALGGVVAVVQQYKGVGGEPIESCRIALSSRRRSPLKSPQLRQFVFQLFEIHKTPRYDRDTTRRRLSDSR